MHFNKQNSNKIVNHTKKNSPVVFTNKRAEVIDSFDCYVPPRIEHIMKSANSVLSTTEFSFFLKCNIDWENRMIEVLEKDDDIFFPKQEVSSTYVNYIEDNKEFNGVVHKHPRNMKNFSTTDDEYINSNFEVSLLWTEDSGFCNGVINMQTVAGKVQLKLNIIMDDEEELDQNIINIVKSKAEVHNYVYKHKNSISNHKSVFGTPHSYLDVTHDDSLTDWDITSEKDIVDLDSNL